MTAPSKAGTMKNPPISGPHSPNNIVPSHEPRKPAMIFPIMPPGISLPMIAPAIAPSTPPTIHVQINPIFVSSFKKIYKVMIDYFNYHYYKTISVVFKMIWFLNNKKA